jgi:predicted ATPase/class 3 adenylate cyclase/DNA-binding CsgD family transcriptional regulator
VFVLPSGTVTLLLGDMEGSTRAWESDPKTAQIAMVEMIERVDELVGRFDGVRPLEQGEGDSFVAAFARARDGVACAFAIQQALVGYPLAFRLGVHTGDVTRRDERNYAGATIIRTARLRNLAHGGQTVVSEATRELVADALPDGVVLRDLGVHRLKDLSRAERVYQLCHPELRDEFPPLRSLDARPHNLPVQRTAFIGREREMAEVAAILADERMVTLTGSGGCGKTRLALQVGAEALDAFADGVWFADLAAVTDPATVPTSLTQVFSLREGPAMSATDALIAYLGGRRAMIILDNCEHLLEAAAVVADAMLGGCPGVVLLATSRQPLGIEGELTWRVPSLPCPGDDGPAGIEGVSASEAAQLFADRARRARPGFALSERNADAVAEICRRLDGIPLAIELAAARARVFTPAQIASGLSQRFALLTGAARTALPRQQTLEASVDWSHNLLTDIERLVFRRLAVFAGSFTFEAAQEVCADAQIESYQVLDLLSLLVDKSLVVAEMDDDGADARYRLLETIRVYALARLEAAGEEAAVRDRHRDHYLGLAVGAGPHLEGPEQDEWTTRLARDYSNIRVALEWARGQSELLTRSSTALGPFWASHGPTNEGVGWLEVVLADAGDLDSSLRAGAAFARAWLATIDWDIETMVGRAQEALAHADEVHDERLAVRCRILLGMVNTLIGGPTDAMERAIEQARVGGDAWAVAAGVAWLGVANISRDLGQARAMLEEAVSVGRSSNRSMSYAATATLGSVLTHQGEIRRAKRELEAAVAELEGLHDRASLAGTLAWLAFALIELGDHPEASRTVDRVEVVGREGGIHLFEVFLPLFRAILAVDAGDHEAGLQLARQALELAHVPMARLGAQETLAEAELGAGMFDEARADAAELEEACRAGNDWHQLAAALLVKASLDRVQGDPARAEGAAHEALAAAHSMGIHNRTVDALEVLAWVTADLGGVEEAARLVGAAWAARDASGYGRYVSRRDAVATALRSAMGDVAYEAAVLEGRSLSLDEAVAYARRGRGERKRPTTGWASLTPMEVQVVDLVREGRTNAEIGEQLYVSPRTVQAHLSRIYTKLGVNGRTALAALPVKEAQ